MSVEIRVPQLPESVADATLVAWRKQPGQAVSRDENLADLETDKVVLEVPAPISGVLREIKVQTGTSVKSGELLALIEGRRRGCTRASTRHSARAGNHQSGRSACGRVCRRASGRERQRDAQDRPCGAPRDRGKQSRTRLDRRHSARRPHHQERCARGGGRAASGSNASASRAGRTGLPRSRVAFAPAAPSSGCR